VRLRDDIDTTQIDWKRDAIALRRHVEKLPPGARQDAEIDRALACEALAHSADLLLRTQTG
jgi:hypothetical protein